MTFPAVFNVGTSLNGTNGFQLTSTTYYFGYSIASIGDFNGDGEADIVIGTEYSIVYVVYGSNNIFVTPFDVDSLLNGTNGFKLTSTSNYFGLSVASAGDFNCDGKADIVIGTSDWANSAYVVYGSNNIFVTPFDVDSLLDGTNGFKLISTSNYFGQSVASAGDFNGDGKNDIVIGTEYSTAYIVYSSKNMFVNPFDVDLLLNGTNGFKLTSTTGYFGMVVASAGDFNGDGKADVVIGTAYSVDTAYIIYGSNRAFASPCDVDSLLNGTNGFKLTSTSSQFGFSVASAGDINDDGKADVIIGTYDGAAYVIYGNNSEFANPFNVDSLLNGNNGFILTSATSSFGDSVASAGDINTDGIPDIAIGASASNTAYIIYGNKSGFGNPFNVDSLLDGNNGFQLENCGTYCGNSVASAIDFNGDGETDILIGAPGSNVASVIYGPRVGNTIYINSSGVFFGTPRNDTFFINATGDVTITGEGGYDTYVVYERTNLNITFTDFDTGQDQIRYMPIGSCPSFNNTEVTYY
jgi:hypothetical protein